MANLLIGSNTFNNVEMIRIKTPDGTYANYKYSHTGVDIDGENLLAIHSSGTQYIDLDRVLVYPSDKDYELYFKFAPHNLSKTQILYGASLSGASQCGNQLAIVSGKLRIDRVSISQTKSLELDQVYVYSETNGFATFDDTSIGAVNSACKDISEKNVFLFAQNGDNGVETGTMASMSLYEFYYKENGVDVIHLYPVLDEDGTPCLFDTVSNTYLYNSGTGTFGYTAIDGATVDAT